MASDLAPNGALWGSERISTRQVSMIFQGASCARFEMSRFPFFPQTKTARQGRGSYLVSIVIPLESRIASGQPRYLSLGASAQLLIAWIPGLLVVSVGT